MVHMPRGVAASFIKQNINGAKSKYKPDTIIIMGDFNTPLLSMGILTREKNHEETKELIYTMDQMGLTDIYRIIHPTAEEYILFYLVH